MSQHPIIMSGDRNGLNIGDPGRFEGLVQDLLGILGDEWVQRNIGESATGANTRTREGGRLIAALAAYPETLDALRNGSAPSDAGSLLFLGMAAFIASEGSRIPGGSRFTKKLRDLARAGQYDSFFDTLFEGEAALYWRCQMQAHAVEFPEEQHPDFWASLVLQGREFRLPNECKRIRPAQDDTDQFAEILEGYVRELALSLGAVKVIVWLHAAVPKIDTAQFRALLKSIAAEAASSPVEGRWHTGTDERGLFQISVAGVRSLGEMAEREITIEDVPAVGPLRVATDTRYLGKAQDPVRLKYILSLRSDVLPDNVGAFERNLGKAIRQVEQTARDIPGVVNVRLHPPRALGDLYEADAIVRRVLRDRGAPHISLVILYWNDEERVEGEGQAADEGAKREVAAKYNLRTHFIAHNPAPIDFRGIDSRTRRFPETVGIVMRDPETGTLVRLGPQFVRDIQAAPSLNGADQPNSEKAATIYMRLRHPFPVGISSLAITAIKTDDRIFVPNFDDAQHFRVVEFRETEPVRVVTVDLRAWNGASELLFHLRWEDDPWTVSTECPHTGRSIVVRAATLRRAFL